MFRCPNCAKVHKIELSERFSVMANKDMTQMFIVPNNFYKDGNLLNAFRSMHKTYHLEDAVTYIVRRLKDLLHDEPICSSCGESAPMEEWVKAFDAPINYFDAENLCSCGSELWMDRIPNTGQYGLVCDDCGWIKPKSTVSASADVTV